MKRREKIINDVNRLQKNYNAGHNFGGLNFECECLNLTDCQDCSDRHYIIHTEHDFDDDETLMILEHVTKRYN